TLLKSYEIVHICGNGNVDESLAETAGYVQYEYVKDELKDLFAIANLVISRAGANAIFEFLALRLPMLLIPLSLAASRGDQIDNALSFQRSGYAHVLEEESLSEEELLKAIRRLEVTAPMMRSKMEEFSSE